MIAIVLHAALRRLAASAHVEAFVLRGAVLTQLWVGPDRRPTRDLDLLGLYPRDLDETVARFGAVLAPPGDGVTFDLDALTAEVIWRETDFPGHRLRLDADVGGVVTPLQIDVGFGDPLVPPAAWIDSPGPAGPPARVQAARPELLVAWKLHGLFEHGARRWRPKDLFDLDLLTRHCALDQETLSEAIQVAFASHGDPLAAVPGVVYDPAWWRTAAAQAKWAKFRADTTATVPADLAEVASAVADRLRPALTELIELPAALPA